MNKAEQSVEGKPTQPLEKVTLTRWRFGAKRSTSKVLATERRSLGWSKLTGEDSATISVAMEDAPESYHIELNHAALKSLVEIFDRNQKGEKIGRAE